MSDPTDLDAMEVYERGLASPMTLDRFEYAVFAIMDFEAYIQMEGWYGMFVQHLNRYHRLKECLAAIGDSASVQVLADFETFLRTRRVRLEACYERGERRGDPDWRELFMARCDERWLTVERWLLTNGRRLSR